MTFHAVITLLSLLSAAASDGSFRVAGTNGFGQMPFGQLVFMYTHRTEVRSISVRWYTARAGKRFNTIGIRNKYTLDYTTALRTLSGAPWKKNQTGHLYRLAKKCYAVLYETLHFNDIFDYHSHICEKNNMTVTWLLLTVSLVVPHAGLIYLYNCRLAGGGFRFGVKKKTFMRLYGPCYLIF